MSAIGTFGRYLEGWRDKAATALHISRPTMKNGPRLALALQGGGAHGAFTWGVLTRCWNAV